MDLKNYLQSIIGNNIEEARQIRENKVITSSSEEAYAYIVGGLRILHKKINAQTLENSITDEDHDQQIDAIVIEDNAVTIYDFKRSEGFGENDIRLFVQSVDKYIFNTDQEINELPIGLQKQITAAREAIDVNGFIVKLRVVRGGGNSEYDQGEKALNEITYDSIVERKLVSLKDLVNEELNLDTSPISYDWNITIKKNASGEKEFKIKTTEDSLTSSLICRISLQQLVKLYHDFQPNPEKIFEKNVRGLQNNKKIGKQILFSLSSRNKSRNFYKLHNGITIVSDKIIEKNTTGYTIRNPQIVNGCQTITTISEKFKNNLESKILIDGSIICKIFAAKNDEVENICLASNSQIAINAADLRTNDSIQIIIESYLRKNGIVYDRKSVRVSPNSSFTFKDLGQWCCACLLLKPAFAKKNKSQIFSSFAGGVYDKIFNDKTNLFEISKIVELALFIRQKIKQLKKKDITYQVAADLHFLAALFMLKDNGWKNEYAFTRVNAIIKKVSEAQLKANPNTTNPIIFTKNDDAWQKIEKEISSLIKIKKGK